MVFSYLLCIDRWDLPMQEYLRRIKGFMEDTGGGGGGWRKLGCWVASGQTSIRLYVEGIVDESLAGGEVFL